MAMDIIRTVIQSLLRYDNLIFGSNPAEWKLIYIRL